MRRMDRYRDATEQQPRRMIKNQELYHNFSNNMIYTNITDVTNANAYDITNTTNMNSAYTTREAYQQMQKYQNGVVPPSKKELEDVNHLYPKKENKIYDINSVLEEARKNRQEKDDKEDKRRLKNNAYNILSGKNKQELEKYREEKKKRMITPEEKEIRELIDTIASKTLAGEIDKATSVDLLSDLMATSIMDKVDGSEELEKITEEVETPVAEEQVKEEEPSPEGETKKEENALEEEESTREQRNSFYAKSMDLSEEDLDLGDDFKESSLSLPVKISIFLVIVSIIAFTIFLIYQRIH